MKEIVVTVYQVDQLLLYFPVYLALHRMSQWSAQDWRTRHIDIDRLLVHFDKGVDDITNIHKLLSNSDVSEANLPFALTGILDSGCLPAGVTKRRLAIAYTLAIRIPIWGVARTSRAMGRSSVIDSIVGRGHREVRHVPLDELSEDEVRKLTISSYGEGTTVHTYLKEVYPSHRRFAANSWKEIVEVQFAQQQRAVDNWGDFCKLDEVDVVFSLNPWLRPSDSEIVIAPPTHVYPFTSIVTLDGVERQARLDAILRLVDEIAQRCVVQLYSGAFEELSSELYCAMSDGFLESTGMPTRNALSQEALPLLSDTRVYDVDYPEWLKTIAQNYAYSEELRNQIDEMARSGSLSRSKAERDYQRRMNTLHNAIVDFQHTMLKYEIPALVSIAQLNAKGGCDEDAIEFLKWFLDQKGVFLHRLSTREAHKYAPIEVASELRKLAKSYLFIKHASLQGEDKPFRAGEAQLAANMKRWERLFYLSVPECKYWIDGEIGAFYTIFENLIYNSLFHGFDEALDFRIDMTISTGDGSCVVEYTESGKGFFCKKEDERMTLSDASLKVRAWLDEGSERSGSHPGHGLWVAKQAAERLRNGKLDIRLLERRRITLDGKEVILGFPSVFRISADMV